jgi:hypothetical protein
MQREYKTSLQFPAKYGETIIVRDGQGRTVEQWTVIGIDEGKHNKFVTFSQHGYKSVARI